MIAEAIHKHLQDIGSVYGWTRGLEELSPHNCWNTWHVHVPFSRQQSLI